MVTNTNFKIDVMWITETMQEWQTKGLIVIYYLVLYCWSQLPLTQILLDQALNIPKNPFYYYWIKYSLISVLIALLKYLQYLFKIQDEMSLFLEWGRLVLDLSTDLGQVVPELCLQAWCGVGHVGICTLGQVAGGSHRQRGITWWGGRMAGGNTYMYSHGGREAR